MSERPLALTWAFNSAFSITSLLLSDEWNDWPWFSRVAALLLAPYLWFFGVASCSIDVTFRRFCLGFGTFFLGSGLVRLLAGGPTWESFRQESSALTIGVGLLAAAAAGRACRVNNPDPTRTRHGHE